MSSGASRERSHLSNDQCAELLGAVIRRATVLPTTVISRTSVRSATRIPLAVKLRAIRWPDGRLRA